jgi:hypothetical protein
LCCDKSSDDIVFHLRCTHFLEMRNSFKIVFSILRGKERSEDLDLGGRDINMEIGREGIDLFHLDQSWASVNTVMHLKFIQTTENFLSSCVTVCLS